MNPHHHYRIQSASKPQSLQVGEGTSFSTQDCADDHKSPFCQSCDFFGAGAALHVARVTDPVGVKSTRLAKKAFAKSGLLFKHLTNERIGPLDDLEERNAATALLRKSPPETGYWQTLRAWAMGREFFLLICSS